MHEEMKLEIGRMLQEGVSGAGIQAVVEAWKRTPSLFPTYARYVEYGFPPINEEKVVEGSLTKPLEIEKPLAPNEYRCAMCKQVYEKAWTDEEAWKETQGYWPDAAMQECAVICDDCWQKIHPDDHPQEYQESLQEMKQEEDERE